MEGIGAVKNLRLAKEAGVSEEDAKLWLKQATYQIYLPASKRIPRPTFDVESSHAAHQRDLLLLPHNRLPRGTRVHKYVLTIVDVKSRFKAAGPLTSKDSTKVSRAFHAIFKRGPLR